MPNAIAIYRIARWFYLKKIPLIPKLFQLFIFMFYNCRVPVKCHIGKGSFFVVKGIGVSLHDKTVIGEQCSIGIGCKTVGKGPFKEVPNVGDRVFIGPGAVLVGPIVVGDNAIIGANSVVTKSVPEGAIVGGIPAKIIGWVKDNDYDIHDNRSDVEGTAPFLQDLRG
ncbi:serine acetyltransferase [Vibrio coralliilyticus]|jgi:serine O-acetyltransferase|uniref:Serine acetyltransferase n=1 Tax=Vibrio coralliilyticus TaxID=190893 RepID=A0A097AW71_9VIBR|nr:MULTISPECIES: DapH/DapD/GlmU-related protein [Vibrio]AIS56681.1 serine acetyltransferase [Vibrio coralliilyticus]AIW21856.1 serine acetyltransferase [Vibrio coralliilyticus]ANW26306.1 serine acetyltransferase [Vibrio coralliilyticus]EEX33057.1 serine acetyltransferase [Vibrio coralliilyticus ATCC BAA-450]KJY72133.1 serine acetyltransferase [Vibrio coralliilyticus]